MIIPSTGLPANNIAAIGAPLARLFLDPQKTPATSSSWLKPKLLAVMVVINNTNAKTIATIANTKTNCNAGIFDQIFEILE